MRTKAIDLFAGAGGFSEGARMAGVDVVWAANHWPAAVEVHANNHPETEHACQDLHQTAWHTVPAHDLLMASPACQGHSRARGKERPHHDALRSTAWAVVSAAECHKPPFLLVENVPEFTRWALFPAWCSALHSLGYALCPMVLDAADHGVAQHRRRLFVVGTQSQYPVDLRLPEREHVPAANIIEFDAGRWSDVHQQGRSLRTLERIAAGRAAYGPRFVTAYYGNEHGARSISRPLGTLTTKDRYAVIDGERMRMLSVNESRKAMGFPDCYRLPSGHADAIKMLGNAVCPPVARDVINALKAVA